MHSLTDKQKTLTHIKEILEEKHFLVFRVFPSMKFKIDFLAFRPIAHIDWKQRKIPPIIFPHVWAIYVKEEGEKNIKEHLVEHHAFFTHGIQYLNEQIVHKIMHHCEYL